MFSKILHHLLVDRGGAEERCSSPITIFTMLYWTHFSISTSQSSDLDPTPRKSLIRSEQRVRVISLDLLAIRWSSLTQEHCWLMVDLVSNSAPRYFSKLFSCQLVYTPAQYTPYVLRHRSHLFPNVSLDISVC